MRTRKSPSGCMYIISIDKKNKNKSAWFYLKLFSIFYSVYERIEEKVEMLAEAERDGWLPCVIHFH